MGSRRPFGPGGAVVRSDRVFAQFAGAERLNDVNKIPTFKSGGGVHLTLLLQPLPPPPELGTPNATVVTTTPLAISIPAARSAAKNRLAEIAVFPLQERAFHKAAERYKPRTTT
jgi:hypothetical protein